LSPDAAAADPPATPGAAARRCRHIEPNGPQLTGTRMTMETPGCPPVPDVQLRVADLARGVALPGGPVHADVALHGGELGGQRVKGPELIGALLLGEAELGGTVRLRLDDIEQAPDPNPKTPINENADVFRYRISYQFGSGSGPAEGSFHPSSAWQPLCSGDNQAIAVAGEWDLHQGTAGSGGKRSSSERAVTFACVGSAIAKCVERLGYKPWQSVAVPGSPTKLSLDELHQSCVRAVRADYCGTGESLTKTGERVNFYDRVGINRDDSDWPLEAQWTPRGASCVAGTRLRTAPADARVGRTEMPARAYVQKSCPKVWAAQCPAAPGSAVLWTEATPSAD
jgi:hypothetical protein